jgi:hypothetical protein
MPLLNKEKFLEEVISQVKFKYDRYDIKKELEVHILDKMEYYIEQGYDIDKAEELSINDMGDAKVIGKELNKLHNPLIGLIWYLSNVFLVITIVISFYLVGINFISLFSRNPINDFPKSEIVYKIDVNKKVKIDDRVIHFTNVIYDKNGDMNIFYKYYNTRLWVTGWSLGTIGEISDNLGNVYFAGGGQSSGGIITKSQHIVTDFSKEADTLIINYDMYNRKFKVEIPLKAGDISE